MLATMFDLAAFPARPRTPQWRYALRQGWPFCAIGLALVLVALALIAGRDESDAVRETAIGFLLLPGIACAMWWSRVVMRYRVLLSDGEIIGGELEPDPSGRGRLTFRFFDAVGREFRGVGQVVTGAEPPSRRVFVVFDRNNPRVHRLVVPEEFARP